MAEAGEYNVIIFHDKYDESPAIAFQSLLESRGGLARSRGEAIISAIHRTESVEDLADTLEGASRSTFLIPVVSQTSSQMIEEVVLNKLGVGSENAPAFSVHWLVFLTIGDPLMNMLVETGFAITLAEPGNEDSIEGAAQEVLGILRAGLLGGSPPEPQNDWGLPPPIAKIFIEADVSPSPVLQRLLISAAEQFLEQDESTGEQLVSVSSLFYAMYNLGGDPEEADQVSWTLRKTQYPSAIVDSDGPPPEAAQ